MLRTLLSLALALGFCVLLTGLSGCHHGGSVTIGSSPHATHGEYSHHGGPPAHAPAHGHRRKHHHHGHGGSNVELVFDSGLGVYVVVGIPNHYYWDGHYLRIDEGRWFRSTRLTAGWRPYSEARIPAGLRGKGPKHKVKGRKRGRGPASRF